MFHRNKLDQLAIPPLISGGVMLTYKCSNTCRHCLYRCSPKRPNDWMSLDMAERVFAALREEPQLSDIHISGGEAGLRFERLVEIVALASRMNVTMSYLETNAAWCADNAKTKTKLQTLKKAGLPGLLVSCSLFHNEFVPFARTRNCVEMGQEVFGAHNVIVWLPQFYKMLAALPDDTRTYTLEELCELVDLPIDSPAIPGSYGVRAAGSSTEALRACYSPSPVQAFRRETCRADLMSTYHFHVDVYGNLLTGLCPGIAPGNIDDFHPPITYETAPVFTALCREGPAGLMEMAAENFAFEPRQDGYVSKCDLCYDIRKHLHSTGQFPELQPGDYYSD